MNWDLQLQVKLLRMYNTFLELEKKFHGCGRIALSHRGPEWYAICYMLYEISTNVSLGTWSKTGVLSVPDPPQDVCHPLSSFRHRYRSNQAGDEPCRGPGIGCDCGNDNTFVICIVPNTFQVERALHAWKMGKFVFDKKDPATFFSRSKWGRTTAKYTAATSLFGEQRWDDIKSGTKGHTKYAPREAININSDNDSLPDPHTLNPESGKWQRTASIGTDTD